MSGKLGIVLTVLLVVSALSLVRAQNQSRRLFIELEQAQTKARQLETEWSQLQLEQSTLGKHARLSEAAHQELNMIQLTPERTQYLHLDTK